MTTTERQDTNGNKNCRDAVDDCTDEYAADENKRDDEEYQSEEGHNVEVT